MIYKFNESILYAGDTIDLSKQNVADNSVDLLLIDPPYNIGKGKWDSWITAEAYREFLKTVFLQANRVLKTSGSAYIFHQVFKDISWIHDHLIETYSWNLKQFITWNKRFDGVEKKGFLDGYVMEVNKNRNYPQMSEYILFFTKQPDHFDNPFVRVMKDNMAKHNLTHTHLSKLVVSKNGKRTGWASTKLRGVQLPTTDQWQQLCKLFQIEYEYEQLRDLYEQERYYFDAQGTDHSVWNYASDWRCWHPTPKPVDLYQNIIRHSYRPNGLILDMFTGSGNIIKAANSEKANLITFESDLDYIKRILNDLS